MLLATPYAFAGLITIAGLVALYTLRTRYKRYPVSNLMLWHQARRVRQGGARRQRLILPPLFFLELCILLAILLAALSPHMRRPTAGTVLLVCDNSASMSARDQSGITPQKRAAQALREIVKKEGYTKLQVLLADASGPLNVTAPALSELPRWLEKLACYGSADTVATTLARACEVATPDNDIIVVTDRPPPADLTLRPGLRWLSCGSALENLALTAVERTANDDGSETLLVEVTAFPAHATAGMLSIRTLDRQKTFFEKPITLDSNGVYRQWLNLPPATPALVVQLPDDALALDNKATLLPEHPAPLPVSLQLADPALADIYRRVLQATGAIVWDDLAPRLVFSQTAAEGEIHTAPWRFVVTPPQPPSQILEPLLVNKTHPLMEGVEVDGLSWPCGTNNIPGIPLLLSGHQALLTLETPSHRPPTLHLISAHATDSLYRCAAWPALIHNLIAACRQAQPGPPARNLRAGVLTTFTTAHDVQQQQFVHPQGTVRHPVHNGAVHWAPTIPGLYRMRLSATNEMAFSVNFCAPAESDLSRNQGGVWGHTRDPTRLQRTHHAIAWICCCLALILGIWHHFVTSRSAIFSTTK